MSDQHISSAFDRDLQSVQAQILHMGEMVEQAVLSGVKALIEHDTELAEEVRKGDKAIDRLELQIEDEAARIIALRAPVSADLRMVLTVMRLASGLERMGDYAKNIAKRTTVLAVSDPSPGTGVHLRRMANEVQSMLRDVLLAFTTRDAELAHRVIEQDEEVDQIYNSLFREFLTFMMEDPRAITACMHLHFIAKNLERMGDLVTNMAEQVVYLVTGERPDERQKADTTPYMSAPE